MSDELIEKIVKEISDNHHKIIDDWCKAYLAQLYEEGKDIKPGCFKLIEQLPTLHDGLDCMVKRYWFEKGVPEFDKDYMKHEVDELINALKLASKMLDNLKYECCAREYTLDEDNMSNIFFTRDNIDITLKNCRFTT